MSSCLSGGGRTYALDLKLIKSPSHSTRTSHTSSPSSTLSEASNSPIAISTRKARTPRKRPKQTYNEAAALLSTVYPNVFSTKHITNPSKFTKPHEQFFDESAELLLPFRVIDACGFLLHQPIQEKARFPFERKATNFAEKPCQSNDEFNYQGKSMGISGELHEDFDAESILDEEIEEGIDSIMGNLGVENEATINESSVQNYWHGSPMGIGFGGKPELVFGLRNGVTALRQVDEGNCWSFPTVDVPQISPKFNNSSISSNNHSNSNKKTSSGKKKKKVETGKPAAAETESKVSKLPRENSIPKSNNSSELLLKLQYDDVLNAWSNRGSPFLDGSLASDVQRNDISAGLAQIDLFSDSGVREANVLRYNGKRRRRRRRAFSKKIRFQVRKSKLMYGQE